MSEILIGVIIGGLIASITPIINMIIEYRRWKRQTKLEHLKQERARLNEFYVDVYKRLASSTQTGAYSHELIAGIIFLIPREAAEEFDNLMKDQIDNASSENKKTRLLNIMTILKRKVSEMDKQIIDLVN